MPLVYRLTKGSPLTHAELDGNFQFLTGSINSISGAYATTGSNTFIGNQTIQGNLTVLGTGSFTYTTSSITVISASTFAVSISSPTIRYGIYDVLDSGASIATSSLAWDSLNKYWIYRNITGSVTSSAILLTGPVGTGGLGTEASIPQYRVPMSNGNQSLVSSNIYSSGSANIITGSITAIGSNNTALITAKDIASDSIGFAVNSGNDNKGFFWYAQPIDRLAIGIGGVGSLFMSASNAGANGFFSFNKQTSNAPIDILGNTIITGSLNVTAGVTGSLLGTATTASYVLNAVSSSFVTTASFYGGSVTSASFATTASYVLNAVSSSFATTASYVLNAVSSSFATTASYVLNAVSASYVLNAVSASRAVSASFSTNALTLNSTASSVFATTGSNNFVGTQNINGNTNITGSLVVSGSSTFRNIGIAEMTGSLLMNTLDGRRLFRASSSLSSSISSSNEPTTASFNGSGFLNTNLGSSQWDSNFDVYYAGVSGGDETQVSPVFTASADNNFYNDFTFGFSPRPQITLSPSGTIQSYKLYVYDSGSSQWYVKSAISENTLENGVTVTLSGLTSTNFGNDLVNTAGFNSTSDPTSNVNTITYVSGTLQSFSSSLVDINAPVSITGSLNLTGSFFVNGQKQFNYISLFHTASISPTQNVSGSFIYSTVATSSGISLTNNSRITFANTGLYNLQFSAQLFTQTGATVDIWFKKNGVNITNSGTKIGPTSNNTYHVPAWNFMDTFESGSYIEIAYQTDQTNTQFLYATATGNIPAIPSIIATVTQVV